MSRDVPRSGGQRGEGVDERASRTMSEVRGQLAISALGIPEVTRLIRARIPALATHTAARIQLTVPAYAGPATGRRHGLIELAVKGALTEFVEAIENPGTHGRGAEELPRRMGDRKSVV